MDGIARSEAVPSALAEPRGTEQEVVRVDGVEGSVGLVVGGAGGIGRAVALDLAACGARVGVADLDPDGLERTRAALERQGRRPWARTVDVGEPQQVEGLFEGAERELGALDWVVNAAGVLATGPLAQCSDREWERVVAVNATGVFAVGREVARRMGPRGRGALVTVASNAASVPRAHMGAYAASKAAALSLTKSLGLELARSGVRCNVVSPGSTDTSMLRAMTCDPQALVEGDPGRFKSGIPLGRLARPQDVAGAVRFLLSPGAGHITMHDLHVDGGAAQR